VFSTKIYQPFQHLELNDVDIFVVFEPVPCPFLRSWWVSFSAKVFSESVAVGKFQPALSSGWMG
jgi:hypothetical protein